MSMVDTLGDRVSLRAIFSAVMIFSKTIITTCYTFGINLPHYKNLFYICYLFPVEVNVVRRLTYNKLFQCGDRL